MIIVDAHCDTLTKVVDSGESLLNNRCHWDIQRAAGYGGFVQILAIFQDPHKTTPSFDRAMRYVRKAEEIAAKTPLLKLCKSYRDISEGIMNKKVCGLLSLEGGEALEGSIENLDAFYNAGIRCITLTWNYANELGDGADSAKHGGLTPFGREIVRSMQQKGMLVDISHASEKAFWDCVGECTTPVIASHSNAREICDHRRNLRNEQISAIAKLRGVIGINFYTNFIGVPGKAGISDLVRHIEHVCGVAGEDAVGIGADFDGMGSLPEPICGVQDLDLLFNELIRLNYSDTVIRKIAGENFLRVFREVLIK